MKRFIFTMIWGMLLPLVALAQTEGYDPENPPQPNWPEGSGTLYQLTCEAIPAGAGQFSDASNHKYPAGKKVTVTAYNHNNCHFQCWKDWQGNELSNETSYTLTMPESDLKLYAVYTYDPGNPGNPVHTDQYMLALRSEPEVACTFNFKDQKVDEGSVQDLRAYANSGFRFLNWTDEKGAIISDQSSIEFLMPSKATTLTAHYKYDPQVPQDPGTNLWDEQAGELIIDYFTRRRMNEAMLNMVGGSENCDKVTHLTIDGMMHQDDFNFANFFKKLTYIDMSRVDGITEVPAYTWEKNKDLKEIELPACIASIGFRAFYQCTALTAIDCYATVPPAVAEEAFQDIPEGLTIFVPEGSIDLYKEAEPWKHFDIQPLLSKICEMEVVLAEDIIAPLKNYTLQIVNVKSGLRYKFTINNQQTFSFVNLVRGTVWDLTISTPGGKAVVEKKLIGIDQDVVQVPVQADEVAQLVSQTIQVLGKNGETDLTADVKITWTDADGQKIGEGAVAGELKMGETVYASIERTGKVIEGYLPMKPVAVTVDGGTTVVQMQEIKSYQGIITITMLRCYGPDDIIIDIQERDKYASEDTHLETLFVETGSLITIKQDFGEGHVKTTIGYSGKTDDELLAAYKCPVFCAVPTIVTISHEGFGTRTIELTAEEIADMAKEIGGIPSVVLDVDLYDAPGNVVGTVDFTWQPAVAEGEEQVVQTGYPDFANVTYTIRKKASSEEKGGEKEEKPSDIPFTLSYPKLRIESGLKPGDAIEVTAHSVTGDFDDTTVECVVDENRTFQVSFHIVQHGGIRARFLVTDNTAVRAILQNEKGETVQNVLYNNFNPKALEGTDANDITLSNLPAGTYTLITMGDSEFFISNPDRFEEVGLKEGVDYVKNIVKVEPGKIVNVRNVIVPLLEESKFYYTGPNTAFSVNKANVIQGNYLRMDARVDFSDEVKHRVSEVELVFPLPVNSMFVEGSLMVNKKVAQKQQYQYTDNRTWVNEEDANGTMTTQYSGQHELTVQLGEDFTEAVKFCITPIRRGNFTPTAYVRFKLDGKTILQPIGSATFTVNDVTIWTPDLVSLPTVHVDGNAPAFSEVSIFDNDYLIGQTTSLADGYWQAEVELDDGYPVNLSMHQIRAEIVTPDGLRFYSERRYVEYNEHSIQAKTVEMSFYGSGRTVIVNFDLEHTKVSQPSYPFTSDTEFVFTADLTNNSPEVVEGCVVRVFTNNHEWVELPAQYIPNMDRWVAHSKFDMQHIPIGVRVNVECDISDEIDQEELNKDYEYWSNTVNVRPASNRAQQNGFSMDLTPVGDEHLGLEGTYFQCQRSALDDAAYTADTLSMATMEGGPVKIYLAQDGSFFVENPSDGGKVWGMNMAQSGAVKAFNSRRATIDTQMIDQLKQTILGLSDLATFLVKYTNRYYLEYQWMEYRKQVEYWQDNPPSSPAQQASLAHSAMLMNAYAFALQNLSQISGLVKDLNLLLSYVRYGIEDENEWQAFVDRILPCDGLDDPQARALSWLSQRDMRIYGIQYLQSVLLACISSQMMLQFLQDSEVNTEYASLSAEAMTVLFGFAHTQPKAILNYATNTFLQCKAASRNSMRRAKRDKNRLVNCNYDFAEVQLKNWDFSLPYPIVEPIIDPSGFVYEGVPANRLEGVTATAYCKRTYEDQWGDLQQEISVWDASGYGQQNPLLTDEKGFYQWDVPQGTWQVKFEKEGYQTTTSDWLPVPPPQLDVNIGMTQLVQPEVVRARAFEAGATSPAGVEITFSKYMKPELLDAEHIFIKGIRDDDETLLTDLSFSCPDEEPASEGSDRTYARKVFVATGQLSQFDEAEVIVSRTVQSYAGIQMAATFQQRLDKEKLITELRTDSLLLVGYQNAATLRIAALPTEAAAGKTVRVKTASLQTAALGNEGLEEIVLTLDGDGQAEVRVSGELFGTTALTLQVEDEDVEALTMVSVVDPAMLDEVQAPIASRISGTAVFRGQSVSLSCQTEGAAIWYTTDGSCPCDSPTRRLYQGPISINGPLTLKIMSIGMNGSESEVREYNYLIRQSNLSLNLAQGWNWASHDLAAPLSAGDFQDIASQVITSDGGDEIRAGEAVKIEAPAEGVKDLSGDQYNPAARDIVLDGGWNWLGYPIDQTLPLQDALAYLQPEEGDLITSLTDGFSEYVDGQWSGTLTSMQPGQGYLYRSLSGNSFIYNNTAAQDVKRRARARAPQAPWNVDRHRYPNLMAITAQLYIDGILQEPGAHTIAAFCGEECRGIGQYADGVLRLPVYGDQPEELTFKAYDNETGEVRNVNSGTTFQADALGSYYQPYIMQIGKEVGISSVRPDNTPSSVYNLMGQKIDQKAARRGVFIIDRVKVAVK